MQKINDLPIFETVMTYDEWLKEYNRNKNIIRSRKKKSAKARRKAKRIAKAKKILFAISATVLFTSIFACAAKFDGDVNNTRVISGVYNGYDTVRTNDGHIWEYINNEVFKGNVKVTFDTKGTENITDDEIIFCKRN